MKDWILDLWAPFACCILLLAALSLAIMGSIFFIVPLGLFIVLIVYMQSRDTPIM